MGRGQLKIEPGATIGAEISGVVLTDELPQATLERIAAALFKHHVLVFRNQSLTSEQQTRFANRLGTALAPEPSKGLTTHEELHPEVQWLAHGPDDNPLRDRRPTQADAWHTDYSYLPNPPQVSFLHGVSIPTAGPDTLYIDMQRAYQALPPERQVLFAGLRAIHSQKGALHPAVYRLPPYIAPGETPDERLSPDRSTTHPLVGTNVITGAHFIYISQCYTIGFEGIQPREGYEIISEIYRHAVQPEFCYRHEWRQGDCVISNNWTTNHRRSEPLSSLSVPRILRRVMVYLDNSPYRLRDTGATPEVFPPETSLTSTSLTGLSESGGN